MSRVGEELAEAPGTQSFQRLMEQASDRFEARRRRPTTWPKAEERQARQPAPLRPQGPFPIATQEALCRRLSERLGLDFNHARLDRSAHPFSGGTRTDVRITTRYDRGGFRIGGAGGGARDRARACTNAACRAAFDRQPVGEAAGMAAHESQSLIVEMQACRSDAFLSWLGPELHATFGGDAAPYQPANLARLWRRVERGFIRVDADEMTYPAHVILRFRLEQAMVAGDLAVADLPGAWNEGFAALLGMPPPDDARGCLQDIHWYDGAFGYFPSYTLGAMAAAQLMAAARRDVAGIDAALGPRRPLAAARLVARQGAQPGQPARFQRPAARGDRQTARSKRFRSPSDSAVPELENIRKNLSHESGRGQDAQRRG